jgi:methyl-accepting chemotaxis protein
MKIAQVMSYIGVRPRVFGGFAMVLSFLVLLAGFAIVQVERIGGTVDELVTSAAANAGMSQTRASLLEAHSAVEKFIRTWNLGDKAAAAAAIEHVGKEADQVERQFGKVEAIGAGLGPVKAALETYRTSFTAAADAADRLRTATNKTDAQGAAAGLNVGAIQVALANRPEGAERIVNPMRLAGVVDGLRLMVMRYASTLSTTDADDAKIALSYAQLAIKDSEAELAGFDETKLKAMVAALKTAVSADAAALYEVITVAADLRARQADLKKASTIIEDQVNTINAKLATLRAEQGDRTASAVSQTRQTVIAAATVALLLGALLAWLIGASVSGPIRSMTDRMQSLAAGELNEPIPGGKSRDEIGRMARAVEVFRENALAVHRMQADAETQREAAESERVRIMTDLAGRFEQGMQGVIAGVGGRADDVGRSAEGLALVAERGRGLAEAVATRAEQASMNVQTVAAATQQLAASIREISAQVQRSVTISNRATDETSRTFDLIHSLSEAAEKIGDIIQLIQAIASQTNLLALNATIEAARAGDAGRGFAVVASEVKSLATQTAQATEQIASQITMIQSATGQSVQAIKQFGLTVKEMAAIASAIAAAVEEQGAATSEIARNVEEAATGTSAVTQEIGQVRAVAGETDAGAEAALELAAALKHQASSMRSNVEDFLHTIRSAA